jgi:sialate O-acetylesterase
VLWYQGESNAGHAYQYQTLLPTLIRAWRETWGQGEFPFLLVQVAPFFQLRAQPEESDWAELREAQRLTSLNVPKTALIVTTDLGEATSLDPNAINMSISLHPRKKEPVGARLALAARAIAYREAIEYSGPVYESMKVNGDRAMLKFQHARGGLVAKDGELKGFTIAGEDRKFVHASAEIKGSEVIVWSPSVAKPVAVRFGWARYPVVNLCNKEGLPASPFRTDDFPMITAKN